jgi:hypothetical protein
MPRNRCAVLLLAEVMGSELLQCGQDFRGVRPVRPNCDRGALGHSQGQDAENTLCVPYRPILDELDPGVFVTAGRLDEQRCGASVEADRVGDGEGDLWNGNPPSRALWS